MSEWDPKPVLLYFHFEHEDGQLGSTSAKQCKKFDDERVARWSHLYTFVEIDVAKSDPTLLKRFGALDRPSFTVVNQDLEIIKQSPILSSSKAIAGFLKSTVQKGFPEYWKTVKERLDEQKATLKEAKSLEKQKDYEGALSRVREVTMSNLRVGAFWEDAVQDGKRLERKAFE